MSDFWIYDFLVISKFLKYKEKPLNVPLMIIHRVFIDTFMIYIHTVRYIFWTLLKSIFFILNEIQMNYSMHIVEDTSNNRLKRHFNHFDPLKSESEKVQSLIWRFEIWQQDVEVRKSFQEMFAWQYSREDKTV